MAVGRDMGHQFGVGVVLEPWVALGCDVGHQFGVVGAVAAGDLDGVVAVGDARRR